jgi:Kef-type K+ transport system membrane component KefB
MLNVDATSFFVITVDATVSALTVAVLPRRIAPPVVVLELLLGIVVGPEVLDVAQSDEFTEFFGNLGLGMLFFFAGLHPVLTTMSDWLLRNTGVLEVVVGLGFGAIFLWNGISTVS